MKRRICSFARLLWFNQTDSFNLLFGETSIGQHSTPDRNSYLILFFNFALVNPAIDKLVYVAEIA